MKMKKTCNIVYPILCLLCPVNSFSLFSLLGLCNNFKHCIFSNMFFLSIISIILITVSGLKHKKKLYNLIYIYTFWGLMVIMRYMNFDIMMLIFSVSFISCIFHYKKIIKNENSLSFLSQKPGKASPK